MSNIPRVAGRRRIDTHVERQMARIKLQDSSERRIKVRDLAKEIDETSAAVMAVMKEQGEYVSSIHSYIEPPVARRVREAFKITPLKDGPPAPPEVQPASTSSPGLSASLPRPRRDNYPMMNDGARRRDFSWVPRPVPTKRRTSTDSFTTETPEPAADFAAATRSRPSHAFEHLEWKVHGIGEVEQLVWMSHGLAGSQARVAAECAAAGITPGQLGTDLDGWTIRERLSKGEGAATLARRLRPLASIHRFAGSDIGGVMGIRL